MRPINQNINTQVIGNNNTVTSIIKNIFSNVYLLDVIVIILYGMGCISYIYSIILYSITNIVNDFIPNFTIEYTNTSFIWIQGFSAFLIFYCSYYKSKKFIISLVILIITIAFPILLTIEFSNLAIYTISIVMMIILITVYASVRDSNKKESV